MASHNEYFMTLSFVTLFVAQRSQEELVIIALTFYYDFSVNNNHF